MKAALAVSAAPHAVGLHRGFDRHDESLPGACEPDVLEVLHRHASRWGGLASLGRVGDPLQYSLDQATSLQSRSQPGGTRLGRLARKTLWEPGLPLP